MQFPHIHKKYIAFPSLILPFGNRNPDRTA